MTDKDIADRAARTTPPAVAPEDGLVERLRGFAEADQLMGTVNRATALIREAAEALSRHQAPVDGQAVPVAWIVEQYGIRSTEIFQGSRKVIFAPLPDYYLKENWGEGFPMWRVTPLYTHPDTGREEVIEAATFLLERLDDLERGWDDEEAYNDFASHVTPAMARLRYLTDALPPTEKQAGTETES